MAADHESSRRKQDYSEICWEGRYVSLAIPLLWIYPTYISQEYEPIHPPDAITTNLPPEKQYV